MAKKQDVTNDQQKYLKWITDSLSAYGDAQSDFEDSRKYYEHAQAPASVPTDKLYIIENIITDTVDYFVGKIVGGSWEPTLQGGGQLGKSIKELHSDIIERNQFKTRIVEPIANMFYCEGYCGLAIPFNPFRISPYGVGMPEIYYLRPNGEILLDPAGDYLHDNDTYRIQVDRVLVEYAEGKYPHLKGKIHHTQTKSANTKLGYSQDKYCDIYTIQFYRSKFVPAAEHRYYRDGKRELPAYVKKETKLEEKVFYQVKVINKGQGLMAEEEAVIGINRFSIIPVIHTPRYVVKQLPYGLGLKIKPQQDQMNITSSVALEAVMHDIKNLKVGFGLSPEEEQKAKDEVAKIDGFLNIKNVNSKLEDYPRQGVSPGLIQWYQWQRNAIDEIVGRYRERQAAEGDKSGKAVFFLQEEGKHPELVRKLHLEKAFTEMCLVILEYIALKMKQPFSLPRKIDGEDKELYFNYGQSERGRVKKGYDKNYNVEMDGIINDLTKIDIDDIDLSVDIQMNQVGRRQQDVNNAYVANSAGLLSRLDLTKEVYPDKWKEIFDNKNKEDQALALVAKISQLHPNAIKVIDSMVNDVAGQMAEEQAVEEEEKVV